MLYLYFQPFINLWKRLSQTFGAVGFSRDLFLTQPFINLWKRLSQTFGAVGFSRDLGFGSTFPKG
jgi:hypothetical protein